MLTFALSFTKELLMTAKTRLEINHKNLIATIIKTLAVFIGEITTAFVLNVSITYSLLFKVTYVASAVFIASMIVNITFNRMEKDKPYEFIVRFRDIKTCEEVNYKLREYGIKTYFKHDSKKLIVDSKNKQDSKIIESVIDGKFKNLKKNELKEYIKIK